MSRVNGNFDICQNILARSNCEVRNFLIGFPFFESGQAEKIIELPLTGNGYNYQAVEVMNCLRRGQLESETMPLDETLTIMQTMDQIRAQGGLKCPMES